VADAYQGEDGNHYHRWALCRAPSALDKDSFLHSAKPLPSTTLGEEPPSNLRPAKAALPSTRFQTLDKDFAECRNSGY
jgi:hypothetical protein